MWLLGHRVIGLFLGCSFLNPGWCWYEKMITDVTLKNNTLKAFLGTVVEHRGRERAPSSSGPVLKLSFFFYCFDAAGLLMGRGWV